MIKINKKALKHNLHGMFIIFLYYASFLLAVLSCIKLFNQFLLLCMDINPIRVVVAIEVASLVLSLTVFGAIDTVNDGKVKMHWKKVIYK